MDARYGPLPDQQRDWRADLEAAVAASRCANGQIATIIGAAVFFQVGLALGEWFHGRAVTAPLWLILAVLLAALLGAWVHVVAVLFVACRLDGELPRDEP